MTDGLALRSDAMYYLMNISNEWHFTDDATLLELLMIFMIVELALSTLAQVPTYKSAPHSIRQRGQSQ